MTSEHQLALSRAHRMPAPSNHISKATRQVVPAFLQKLYEMVNDPNNAELIRWSDAGDSFFVLDHERFAHEVLGRWFKHRNFSSFVRQLNMYGFHKIPHLQQGVLKSDTETEFWNFAHANFHRGQPDLLCLIQRKKQLPQPGDETSIDLPAAIAYGGALPVVGATGATVASGTAVIQNGNPTLSSGQILDIQSIANGITAIKRHQATISSELNELKRSNQLLWQDALASRGRQQKQQDTINRIVKFLAGVFGQHVNPGGTPGGGGTPGVAAGQGKEDGVDRATGIGPGTRRKMMLMIEDAKRDGPKKNVIEELNEIPLGDTSTFDDTASQNLLDPTTTACTSPSDAASTDNPNATNLNTGSNLPPDYQQYFDFSQPTPNFDFPFLAPSNFAFPFLSPEALIPFQSYDPSSSSSSSSPTTLGTNAGANGTITSLGDTNLTLLNSSPSQEQREKMAKQWETSEILEDNVKGLHSKIHSLAQALGLDPVLLGNDLADHPVGVENDEKNDDEMDELQMGLQGQGPTTTTATTTDATGTTTGVGPLPSSSTSPTTTTTEAAATMAEFDFASFFNNITSPSTGIGTDLDSGMDYTSAVFLDEVPTPSTSSSDLTGSPALSLKQDVVPEVSSPPTAEPAAGPPRGTRKRKDAAMDLDSPGTASMTTKTTAGSGKSKRRRDK